MTRRYRRDVGRQNRTSLGQVKKYKAGVLMYKCLILIMFPFFLCVRPISAVAGSSGQPTQSIESFRDCSDCPEMVTIPAGNFLMGSSDAETARDLALRGSNFLARYFAGFEHPQHAVTIARAFGLGKYPVTRAEFAAFVRETGYSVPKGCIVYVAEKYRYHPDAGWRNPEFTQTDRDPVVCVSWRDARAYIAWLNGKVRGRSATYDEGPYRLPSEAEWEYAARAGTRTARWWGDDVGSGRADCDGCGSQWDAKSTAPVGSFQPNPFGLYDMLGNVWERVADCWNSSYEGAPGDGGAWLTGNWLTGSCDERVMRGGYWSNSPTTLRSATRSRQSVDDRENANGFRVAKTLS
jgi:formylglycine-generating enzyme required for sulfatase activity